MTIEFGDGKGATCLVEVAQRPLSIALNYQRPAWALPAAYETYPTVAVMITSIFISGLPRSEATQARTGGLA